MKKYFFLVMLLAVISVPVQTPVEFHQSQSASVTKPSIPESILVVAEKKVKPQVAPRRFPAQVSGKAPRPQKLEHLVIKHADIEMPTGDWIPQNITALPNADYSESVGKRVYQDAHYSYFEGQTNDSIPVAFDPGSQTFHPLSQILTLKKINEDLRQEILAEGLKEYWYHPRLKILSIETSPQEVILLYRQFLKQGLDVRLEVLKDPPRSR